MANKIYNKWTIIIISLLFFTLPDPLKLTVRAQTRQEKTTALKSANNQIKRAEADIKKARDKDADTHSPEELDKAEKTLAKARKFHKNGEYERAELAALTAELWAERALETAQREIERLERLEQAARREIAKASQAIEEARPKGDPALVKQADTLLWVGSGLDIGH